jgi:endonuclease YncB( thermonuclease family)
LIRRIGAATAVLFLAVCHTARPAWGATGKEWVRLADCRYVDEEYNDGDSFHVRCGRGEFIVRLYFVDAPEANLRYPERVREQSEYFGITVDASMRAGQQAAGAVKDVLRQPFVVSTRWASAQGRTRLPRYYAFVEVGQRDLAEWLVGQGLARTKGTTSQRPNGEPSRAVLRRFEALEAEARTQHRGAWAASGRAGKLPPPR